MQKDSGIFRESEKAFENQLIEAKNTNTSHTKDYKLFTNEFIKLQKRFEKFE